MGGGRWSTSALGLISAWLIVSLARQTFDLIGRLWLPVIFNLLQILCCIIGLFAVCQRRRALLAIFAITNLLSTVYNIFLLLWYEGAFPSSSHYAVPLSFGLPFSFSFFLKYTPGCSSHFDLKNSYYVQDDCLIRFSHLEAVQCVLHVILAIASMTLTILMLCSNDERRRTKGKTHSLPTISVESIPRSNGRPLSRVPPSILDTGSIRSGYVNSSYDSREDVNAVRTSPNYRLPPKQQPIQAFPNANYEDPIQEAPQNRQPVSQLQYSKRKSGGQNPSNLENTKTKQTKQSKQSNQSNQSNQIDGNQRQSGIFRKARDHRQNRHSKLPPECPPSSSQSLSSAPGPPLHSLVSFDPKSSNFLTVQERIPSDESDDGHESPPTSDDRTSDDSVLNEIAKPQISLDAQYSKVQKRVLPRPQTRPKDALTPSSYRDAIDQNGGSGGKPSFNPYERKDESIYPHRDEEVDGDEMDERGELDDPAYERISVYRRLGEVKPFAKNERIPDPSLSTGDYSPGNDGSSSDSGIHSGSLPIDWPPPPANSAVKQGPREGMYRKSWRQSQPQWDFPHPPPPGKGLRRVSTAEIIHDDHLDPLPYSSQKMKNDEPRLANPGSSLAEVIRQSIRKSSLMSLEDSTSSSASINGIGSSMASVSAISDGRKSRFQVEQRNNSAVGHYHSAIEMKLVTPAGSTSGQRQTSRHRLSQVPGLTTALGLSNIRKAESDNSARDYGISLMKESGSPGIRLRSSIDPYEKLEKIKAAMISDDSLLV